MVTSEHDASLDCSIQDSIDFNIASSTSGCLVPEFRCKPQGSLAYSLRFRNHIYSPVRISDLFTLLDLLEIVSQLFSPFGEVVGRIGIL